MAELLPCPFCGGEAEIHPAYYGCYVECIDCDASTRVEGFESDAIEAWNTRTNTIPVGNGEDYKVVQG